MTEDIDRLDDLLCADARALALRVCRTRSDSELAAFENQIRGINRARTHIAHIRNEPTEEGSANG